MDESTFLMRCQDLAGDTSGRAWTPDDLAGFFQRFRPVGQALASLFQDIPAGDEVFKRLRQVYRATAVGSVGLQGVDAYFLVREPQLASDDALLRHATAQLTAWRQMAEAINERELVDVLTPIPHVAISQEEPPRTDPNDTESLDVLIHDVQSDWHGQLAPLCPHAAWMHEAFYFIACDDCLAHYAMWPWYANSSPIKEPFRPHSQLWLHGAELRCESPDDVTLYVRRLPSRDEAA